MCLPNIDKQNMKRGSLQVCRLTWGLAELVWVVLAKASEGVNRLSLKSICHYRQLGSSSKFSVFVLGAAAVAGSVVGDSSNLFHGFLSRLQSLCRNPGFPS